MTDDPRTERRKDGKMVKLSRQPKRWREMTSKRRENFHFVNLTVKLEKSKLQKEILAKLEIHRFKHYNVIKH